MQCAEAGAAGVHLRQKEFGQLESGLGNAESGWGSRSAAGLVKLVKKVVKTG